MPKRQDPLLEALNDGRSFTWTIPEGGDLASMRAAVRHGQTITMSPVVDTGIIQVGDIVLVRWHGGTIFHLVGEIEDGRFLIVNSVGKVNGWVDGDALLGVVTEVIEPEPRPDVPALLEQLETSYRALIEAQQFESEDVERLLAIVYDLRWYAERLGAARWDTMPRSNKWSFHQNLWRLARRAQVATDSVAPAPGLSVIDEGKRCVGLTAEILALMEPVDWD